MSETKKDQFCEMLVADGPVALVVRQFLQPATHPDDVIFPPSYANPSQKKGDPPVYNIDAVDAERKTNVCVLDSVPSQANRLEPMFTMEKYRRLVPQINIKFKDGLNRSLLEIGHRVADAAVRAQPECQAALSAYGKGNAEPLAKLAPTSLIFGAWDSRGSGVKIPRLINSIIRAANVVQLKRSAQYFPAINYTTEGLLPDVEKLDPAEHGLAEVPSTHAIGGVQISGDIFREASLNLASLRQLHGQLPEITAKLQRYILGLALLAALTEPDLNLRQGCLLSMDPQRKPKIELVWRSGKREDLSLAFSDVEALAQKAAVDFGVGDSHEWSYDKARLGALIESKSKEKKARGKKAAGQPDSSGGDAAAENDAGTSK